MNVSTTELAIQGGAPVRSAPWPRWPMWDEGEERAVLEALRGGEWGGFPMPNRHAGRFAEAFARFHDCEHGLCVANGTVSLEIALEAAGVEAGSEVVVPAYTFEATAAAVLFAGCVPVFADVTPDTYCLDPAAFEAAIGPRTRAVIPVHLGMRFADLDAIGAIADRHQPGGDRGLRARARRSVARPGSRVVGHRGVVQLPDLEADDRRRGRHRHHPRRARARSAVRAGQLRPAASRPRGRHAGDRSQLPHDRPPGGDPRGPARSARSPARATQSQRRALRARARRDRRPRAARRRPPDHAAGGLPGRAAVLGAAIRRSTRAKRSSRRSKPKACPARPTSTTR